LLISRLDRVDDPRLPWAAWIYRLFYAASRGQLRHLIAPHGNASLAVDRFPTTARRIIGSLYGAAAYMIQRRYRFDGEIWLGPTGEKTADVGHEDIISRGSAPPGD
jgi:hypothetical protein